MARRRMSPPVLASALLIVCLGTASCGSSSDVEQARQRAVSWAATTTMVGEEWSAGHVPDRYAARTLAATRQEVQKSIGRSPATLTPSLQRLADAVGGVEDAVARRDRAVLPTRLRAVESVGAALTRPGERPS